MVKIRFGRSLSEPRGLRSLIPSLAWLSVDELRAIVTDEENQTIGILLCKKNNKALVEITLPRDANIHAREYLLYLPSKKDLQQKLSEWMSHKG